MRLSTMLHFKDDINSEVINFYEVLQHDFPALQSTFTAVNCTNMRRSSMIMQTTHILFAMFTVYVVLSSFINAKLAIRFRTIKRAWSCYKYNRLSKKLEEHIQTRKTLERTTPHYKHLNEFCTDKTRADCKNSVRFQTVLMQSATYVGSDQGHYDGYSQSDFDELLDWLSKIEGTFLLSSFRNKQLSIAAEANGWHQVEVKMAKPMSAQTGKTIEKIEVLTANYPIGIVDGEIKLL
ncbi:MAG: hypothetical protein ACTTKL_08260 [Treponema sp.]